jgi:hypothetical protein
MITRSSQHFGARPLHEEHPIADRDAERAQLAGFVRDARTDGEDLAFGRLFLGGVGDDDAARGLVRGQDAFDQDAVVQGPEAYHTSSP